eukprot:9469324-Pyramimonas_sp.AAC.1
MAQKDGVQAKPCGQTIPISPPSRSGVRGVTPRIRGRTDALRSGHPRKKRTVSSGAWPARPRICL